MPWLRYLVIDLLQPRPGFESRAGHVRSMLKDLLLRGCSSSPSRYNSASTPYLSSSNTALSRRKMRKVWEPAKQMMLFRKSASWDKKILLYSVHKASKL